MAVLPIRGQYKICPYWFFKLGCWFFNSVNCEQYTNYKRNIALLSSSQSNNFTCWENRSGWLVLLDFTHISFSHLFDISTQKRSVTNSISFQFNKCWQNWFVENGQIWYLPFVLIPSVEFEGSQSWRMAKNRSPHGSQWNNERWRIFGVAISSGWNDFE